jgi:hypothetical protein
LQEQECQSVDLVYVMRDRVVRDIVQSAVNDFVTKVRDSRSAKIVLRFYKKDESGSPSPPESLAVVPQPHPQSDPYSPSPPPSPSL